jgi:hypothetical protein
MLKKVNNFLSALSWLNSLKELDWNIGYEIKVSKIENKRSLDQNRLYFLYLGCIGQETGNDKDQLHEFFKAKYLGIETIELKFSKSQDYYINICKSTTKLTTKRFTEYLEKIVIFASTELRITLPNPDDLRFKEFEEYYSQYL